MSRYELCNSLRRELRAVHPRDLQRATGLLVALGVRCVEPEEFVARFRAAGFDTTPVVPRLDPELWEERPVGADWNVNAEDEEDLALLGSQLVIAEPEEVTL